MRANQPTARDRAERWILAVLLSEPQRWAGIVDQVHVADFTDPARRRLAEVYWQHQQDEGEPNFNEFLDVLRGASDGDAGAPNLATLAVELMDDLDVKGEDEELIEPAVLLQEALKLLAELRAGGERDKHLADLRRTSGAAAEPGAASESLRQLQERARRPDLRRVGS